jgi:hypothetical protein
MNAARYIPILGFGLIAVAGIVIFIINLANPGLAKHVGTRPRGIVPWLSLAGVLAFTTGMGLACSGLNNFLVGVSPHF